MRYPDSWHIMDAIQNRLLPICHPVLDVRRGNSPTVPMGSHHEKPRSYRAL